MSAWHTEANRLRIVTINEIKQENPTVRTLTFEEKTCLEAVPGQFVMVWIPSLDEVPMSISCVSTAGISISVEKVGQSSEALQHMKTGDVIGVRGPFGNGFTKAKKGQNVLIIGGGTGLMPLIFLGEQLVNLNVKITFLTGAKTRNELLFLDRIESVVQKVDGNMMVATDDGSLGVKGLVTDPAEKLLAKEKFDMVYACGPEPMMVKVFKLAERFDVPLQLSLERLIRCAIGICGSCVLGRFRVCADGPVFTRQELELVRNEFGHFKLGFDGKKVKT